eukprot:scpid27385/ scgid18713/ 
MGSFPNLPRPCALAVFVALGVILQLQNDFAKGERVYLLNVSIGNATQLPQSAISLLRPGTQWPLETKQGISSRITYSTIHIHAGSMFVSTFDDKESVGYPMVFTISNFTAWSGSMVGTKLLQCSLQFRYLLYFDMSRTLGTMDSAVVVGVRYQQYNGSRSQLIASWLCCERGGMNMLNTVNISFQVEKNPFEVFLWHNNTGKGDMFLLDILRVSCSVEHTHTASMGPMTALLHTTSSSAMAGPTTKDSTSHWASSTMISANSTSQHSSPRALDDEPSSPVTKVVMSVVGALIFATLLLPVAIKAKAYWQRHQRGTGYQLTPTRDGPLVDGFIRHSQQLQAHRERQLVQDSEEAAARGDAAPHTVYDMVGPPTLPCRKLTTVPKHRSQAGQTAQQLSAHQLQPADQCASSTPAKIDNEYTLDISPPSANIATSQAVVQDKTLIDTRADVSADACKHSVANSYQATTSRSGTAMDQRTPKQQHQQQGDGKAAAGAGPVCKQYTYHNALSPFPTVRPSEHQASMLYHTEKNVQFSTPPDQIQAGQPAKECTPNSGGGYLRPYELHALNCKRDTSPSPTQANQMASAVTTPDVCIPSQGGNMQRSQVARKLPPPLPLTSGQTLGSNICLPPPRTQPPLSSNTKPGVPSAARTALGKISSNSDVAKPGLHNAKQSRKDLQSDTVGVKVVIFGKENSSPVYAELSA